MNFFINCQTVAEVKAQYRKLAREHHPDLGGDTATMQNINAQYEAALKRCEGQTSTDSKGVEHTYRYKESVEREVMEFIHNFLSKDLPLQADLIGTWVWITGDTKPHKEVLKELKCRWHSQRACWYFHPSGSRSWGGGGSLEELAEKYGHSDVSKFKKKRSSGHKQVKSA
jgi:hypothetical protein